MKRLRSYSGRALSTARLITATRALTLLEILLAVAILLLAIFPLMGVFDFASVSTKKSKTQSVATGLAVSIKAECQHLPFEDFGRLALDNPGTNPVAVPPEFFPTAASEIERFNDSDKYPDFSSTVMLHPYVGGNKHLIRLDVSIGWKDKKGKPKEVRMATYIISQKVY